MDIYRARFVRATDEGIFVNIPSLDSGSKFEFGPFAYPYQDLLIEGENLTVLSRDDHQEDMVVVGFPLLLNVDLIYGGDEDDVNIHHLDGGEA